MTEKGMHYLISGQVQGVFYRASTQSKAIELGITGWVCNLPNGNVEVMAFGMDNQLNALSEWLWQGPPAATVAAVETKSVAWQKHPFFEIK
jgi:acylphosphatase